MEWDRVGNEIKNIKKAQKSAKKPKKKRTFGATMGQRGVREVAGGSGSHVGVFWGKRNRIEKETRKKMSKKVEKQ